MTKCLTKGKKCDYTKSRRGGPRVARKDDVRTKQNVHTSNPPIDHETGPQSPPAASCDRYNQSSFDIVTPMMLPGAGLNDLDSDRIFDSMFATKLDDPRQHCEPGLSPDSAFLVPLDCPVLRSYGCDRDM